MMNTYLAVDFGGGSGRVMAGSTKDYCAIGLKVCDFLSD